MQLFLLFQIIKKKKNGFIQQPEYEIIFAYVNPKAKSMKVGWSLIRKVRCVVFFLLASLILQRANQLGCVYSIWLFRWVITRRQMFYDIETVIFFIFLSFFWNHSLNVFNVNRLLFFLYFTWLWLPLWLQVKAFQPHFIWKDCVRDAVR